MQNERKRFMQALDDHHQWPCPYIYKFILPTGNLPQFTSLFPDADVKTRISKKGKYTSVTMVSTMGSAKEVMQVYEKAATVPGLMSL